MLKSGFGRGTRGGRLSIARRNTKRVLGVVRERGKRLIAFFTAVFLMRCTLTSLLKKRVIFFNSEDKYI